MALTPKTAFWICIISSVAIYALVLTGTVLECTSESSAFELSPACIIGVITSVLFGLLLIAFVIYVVSSLTGDSRISVTPGGAFGRTGRKKRSSSGSSSGKAVLALNRTLDSS